MPITSHGHDLLESTDDLLTPREVARLFQVDPKTVLRWENDGELDSVRTLGGHRRYLKGQVNELLSSGPATSEVIEALEKVHALALGIGAVKDAARIIRLINTLRPSPRPHAPDHPGGIPAR